MCVEKSPCGQRCECEGEHTIHTAGLTSDSQVEVWL